MLMFMRLTSILVKMILKIMALMILTVVIIVITNNLMMMMTVTMIWHRRKLPFEILNFPKFCHKNWQILP